MNQFKQLTGGTNLSPITFTGRCPIDLQAFHVEYNRLKLPDGTVLFDSIQPYGTPRHRECVEQLSKQRCAYGQIRDGGDDE